MESETLTLLSLGIDPEVFEAQTKPCESTYSFPSAAFGVPDNVVHCQMRGEHKVHKAIYHGIPYTWEA